MALVARIGRSLDQDLPYCVTLIKDGRSVDTTTFKDYRAAERFANRYSFVEKDTGVLLLELKEAVETMDGYSPDPAVSDVKELFAKYLESLDGTC